LDFHVWAVNADQLCFTAKLTTANDHDDTLAKVKKLVEEEFELYHSTIEI
jgi:Co/Zn/Cd efflux system component